MACKYQAIKTTLSLKKICSWTPKVLQNHEMSEKKGHNYVKKFVGYLLLWYNKNNVSFSYLTTSSL